MCEKYHTNTVVFFALTDWGNLKIRQINILRVPKCACASFCFIWLAFTELMEAWIQLWFSIWTKWGWSRAKSRMMTQVLSFHVNDGILTISQPLHKIQRGKMTNVQVPLCCWDVCWVFNFNFKERDWLKFHPAVSESYCSFEGQVQQCGFNK